MNQERILQIIQSPHLTEKASQQMGQKRQYVFKVSSDASKPEIKKAVESLFKVEAEQVNIVNSKTKPKRFGRFAGTRSGYKKAYVRLKPGFDIDLTV
ncbi:MAG: 50S ribosomal protein L23 [Gammaproteobacteria bacterium]|nr:MAG: 50S ribosomal protein L23 [Gammaproteobacteria bacterium]